MTNKTPEEILGERVRQLRTARRWSQQYLADQMTAAGHAWNQATVTKTELAKRPIRVNELVALAQLFTVPVENVLGTHVEVDMADGAFINDRIAVELERVQKNIERQVATLRAEGKGEARLG